MPQTYSQPEGFGVVPPSSTEPLTTSGPTTGSPSITKEITGPASYSITSVSWAPSCGRSYHLIATGGRDGHVRIWRVRPAPDDDPELYYDDQPGHGHGRGETDGGENEDVRWSATVVADFDHHRSGCLSLCPLTLILTTE